jgi:cellular nucleic acid-binding protein
MSNSCPNEVMTKPCPLCVKSGHDSYSCALNRICFNCGMPGHINRECLERRGMPKRIVCGACFISGHHRWECHEKIHNIPAYGATCFACSIDGHFMCDSMKCFFGLKGISCFNCRRKGHHESKCDRPVVDECARNSDLLVTEIERAEAKSLEDELEEQRQKSKDDESGRSRGRDRNSSHRDRNKAKRQPPSRFRPDQSQSSNYGRIQNSSHRRDQSRSPPVSKPSARK